jgi:hypothetical protein
MGIRVTGNTTASSLRVVKPRVSVSAVLAGASASAVTPAVDVSYILLNTSAFLDTTGQFKYVPEIVVVSDAVALAVAKQFADTVDATTTVDDLTLQVVKGLNDSVSFTEVFVAVRVFTREFADYVAPTDRPYKTTSKPFADTYSISDVARPALTKRVFDGVGINDSLDATDGSLFVFAKGVTNIVFAVDTKVFSHNKPFGDMIGASDEGSLVLQNYCDFTYFAEDYVGELRTFT